jgi:hypothetical protein
MKRGPICSKGRIANQRGCVFIAIKGISALNRVSGKIFGESELKEATHRLKP